MANGDMLPLLNPLRNLRVDSLGMSLYGIIRYGIPSAILKMMEPKSTHTVAAIEWMQFSATGVEVTHVDLKIRY